VAVHSPWRLAQTKIYDMDLRVASEVELPDGNLSSLRDDTGIAARLLWRVWSLIRFGSIIRISLNEMLPSYMLQGAKCLS
jgi:hypothetical protein